MTAVVHLWPLHAHVPTHTDTGASHWNLIPVGGEGGRTIRTAPRVVRVTPPWPSSVGKVWSQKENRPVFVCLSSCLYSTNAEFGLAATWCAHESWPFPLCVAASSRPLAATSAAVCHGAGPTEPLGHVFSHYRCGFEHHFTRAHSIKQVTVPNMGSLLPTQTPPLFWPHEVYSRGGLTQLLSVGRCQAG